MEKEIILPIFFSSMIVMLTFGPPLVMNYSNNLLDKLISVEEDKKSGGEYKDILYFIFATDLTVYFWTVYSVTSIVYIILYCINISTNIIQNTNFVRINDFAAICSLYWIVYCGYIFWLVSMAYIKRKKQWNATGLKGKTFWIFSMFVLSIVEAMTLIVMTNMHLGIAALMLTMLFFMIMYFIIWFGQAYVFLPMTALIKLKKI